MNKGKLPIYELGLQELLQKNQRAERIQFTTDLVKAVQEAEVVFIAVGTPPTADGSADISAVLDVAREIGSCLNSYKIIVNKSTVPIKDSNAYPRRIRKTRGKLSIRYCLESRISS